MFKRIVLKWTPALVLALCLFTTVARAQAQGVLAMDTIPHGTWQFQGEIGRRVEANIDHWALRAPGANPGLLEMFQRRDRHLPYAEPVPWAGEFAGKYLIAGVQSLRMSDNAALKPFLQTFVDALIAGQADDGYLGPWPEAQRLLGHWDLWGHYHCMLGLLMWYDATGDQKAYDCTVRAAEAICNVYAEGEKRPFDAGTPQINLAVLHVLGDLYRRTNNARYLALMQRIEEDMPREGDWYQAGLAGTPYYKLPAGGPRWESLHIVQGLVELYRITGKEEYKTSVVNLWKSIRDFDRHPSGAFTTNEQASGTVYAPGAIETCCSVAWEALTIDVLRLTGDSKVADELELTTWNQVLGAQHPSGSWWTYDTPLDGIRAPSYHQINFQYRPGTPELNCCSVNAPRGLGMLTEWAVLQDTEGVVVNFYGPGRFSLPTAQGKLTLEQVTGYPVGDAGQLRTTITVQPDTVRDFRVRLRIPAWAKAASITINGKREVENAAPGAYADLKRTWKPGDKVTLSLDIAPAVWLGEDGRHGHAAVSLGPLLLAFDAHYNALECKAIPPLSAASIVLTPQPVENDTVPGHFAPLGRWTVKAADGTEFTLVDFASAGAHGTDYVAWLPISDPPPPQARLRSPKEGATGSPGPVQFNWLYSGEAAAEFEVAIARDAAFTDIVQRVPASGVNELTLDGPLPEGAYYWKVIGKNAQGEVDNRDGARSFTISAAATAPLIGMRADGLMAASALDGNGVAIFGALELEENLVPADDRHGTAGGAIHLDGAGSKLRYVLPYFPGQACTFTAWVWPDAVPVGGMQQLCSAWATGGDEPLRVCVQGKEVFARVEGGGFHGTPGTAIPEGAWFHVAAVRADGTLTLYVNGAPVQSTGVPTPIRTVSERIGIGFNPLFSGNETFKGRIDDFAFYARALSAEEIATLARG
ncbi:MAG: glycoside hydrolase family 127 protein [Candidatus Hydrogenedentes bacterium]|nr:glycoside hydrolase family 127 protein [Candidatus Hydrogenedentota bacterium]